MFSSYGRFFQWYESSFSNLSRYDQHLAVGEEREENRLRFSGVITFVENYLQNISSNIWSFSDKEQNKLTFEVIQRHRVEWSIHKCLYKSVIWKTSRFAKTQFCVGVPVAYCADKCEILSICFFIMSISGVRRFHAHLTIRFQNLIILCAVVFRIRHAHRSPQDVQNFSYLTEYQYTNT